MTGPVAPVLVTGGTGFIGSRLVEKLVRRGERPVRVLVRDFRRVSRIACFPVEMVRGDVSDRASVAAALEGCDAVVHCAHDFKGDRQSQRLSSVSGTENVCQEVLSQRIRRMVHVSTFAVYGDARDGALTEESEWGSGATAYASLKRDAERTVDRLHKTRGLPAVIIQPTLVYGPYSVPWTVNPALNICDHTVPLVDGGRALCNLLYVDDLIQALMRAVGAPGVDGERFLVSGSEPVTWKAFFSFFERRLGVGSTRDLTAGQLEELVRNRPVAPGNIGMLMRWLRDPKFVAGAARMPLVRASMRMTRLCLPDAAWTGLKRAVLTKRDRSPQRPGSVDRPVFLPDASQIAMWTAMAHVRIDKARRLLGYEPAFGFERGMDLAFQYVLWANVLGARFPLSPPVSSQSGTTRSAVSLHDQQPSDEALPASSVPGN
jgi:nucleoside-diphosphate-sugar epimerase